MFRDLRVRQAKRREGQGCCAVNGGESSGQRDVSSDENACGFVFMPAHFASFVGTTSGVEVTTRWPWVCVLLMQNGEDNDVDLCNEIRAWSQYRWLFLCPARLRCCAGLQNEHDPHHESVVVRT